MGTFRSAIADWNDVPTGSMRPTILDGDRIFLNKMAYDLRVPFVGWRITWRSDPARGDIIIFPSPADGRRLVKRVIGLPGDRIEILGDRVYVNGESATYREIDSADELVSLPDDERRSRRFFRERLPGQADAGHVISLHRGRPAGRFGPYVVPPGHYFCMGDNRHNSFDSRGFGAIDRETVRGRALAVAASVDPDHRYMPRWERFFHKLR